MVTEFKPTQIMRVTTLQTEIVAETSAAEATLFENYQFTNNSKFSKHMPQILRYHMMTTQPGQVGAGSIDHDYAKVVLWDLRLKDKVLEWPLQDCGDTNVNATAFEQCDYMASPPDGGVAY